MPETPRTYPDRRTFGIYLRIETKKLLAIKDMRQAYAERTGRTLDLLAAVLMIDAVLAHQSIVTTDPPTPNT